jgi:hypothetical protein
MTRNEFLQICNDLLIEPNIALENDDLCKALSERNDEGVIEILKNEF